MLDREDYAAEVMAEVDDLQHAAFAIEREVAAAPVTCPSDVAVKVRLALDRLGEDGDEVLAASLKTLAGSAAS